MNEGLGELADQPLSANELATAPDTSALEDRLIAGIASALGEQGTSTIEGLKRLTGGATMESWRFECGGGAYVLRRAPSLAFMEDRPFGHATEAAVIRTAHSAGVRAPEIVAVLTEEDGIGSGFIMGALDGTPDPRSIQAMDGAATILREAAEDLALIHQIDPAVLPSKIPTLNYGEGVSELRERFIEAGGDRPIIALGLRWLEENLPPAIDPVLNHGDFRLGNILAEDGHLTGVLDWELAHFGDRHEDLAFGCMAVWRFAHYDLPALGLGQLEGYFSAYEAAGGQQIDRGRFRFWLVYRTVWWALGCLRMAMIWREGQDRMLERVVISRRTSEQELDLLMLLEADAPEDERRRSLSLPDAPPPHLGEASNGEIATAILEWLTTLKSQMHGHDRFQNAVARNALGMIARSENTAPSVIDAALAAQILGREKGLETPELLCSLKQGALAKLAADVPKYPALAAAKDKWIGEE